jgi:hypothetical protein
MYCLLQQKKPVTLIGFVCTHVTQYKISRKSHFLEIISKFSPNPCDMITAEGKKIIGCIGGSPVPGKEENWEGSIPMNSTQELRLLIGSICRVGTFLVCGAQ